MDKPHRNLQVGDVVIVKDDSAPRNLWKLTHVDQTYPGDDGLVSKVHIAVADDSLDNERRRTRAVAFLERPIQKLILLPPTIHTRTGESPIGDCELWRTDKSFMLIISQEEVK